MGRKARITVEKRFLLTRLVEQYLDLFGSFEARYRLKGSYMGYACNVRRRRFDLAKLLHQMRNHVFIKMCE